ncbi:hypothetical protein BGW42_001497 [Actinomortierella wolfii]|nr:hypothetical protein BGW42_001497 [Actinomortierella wolfii]
MSSLDNPAHFETLQPGQYPTQLKYQQHQQHQQSDPYRDPTLLSNDNPINEPGYQTNQPVQSIPVYSNNSAHQYPSLGSSTTTDPHAPSRAHQAPFSSANFRQDEHHPTDQAYSVTPNTQQQPAQSSLPHKSLPAQDAYHLEKLRQEQSQNPRHKQAQFLEQAPSNVNPQNRPTTADLHHHQKATERLPASTLNDPHHPDSLPTEYRVAPRALHEASDIEQYYKYEHDRSNMSNNVAPGTSTYRNMELPDSGAKISPEIKQADRAQKLKVFEVVQALIQGRLPTNAQLDQFLVRAMTSPSMESRAHMLSPDGKSLYADMKQLLQTLRGVIYEKNEQELFQNLIYHCQSASDSIASKNPSVTPALDVGVSSQSAKKEAKETLDSLVSIAKLVTTNAEFRAILKELIDLAREIFGEGADKLSQQAMVASEKLSAHAQNTSQRIAESTQNNQGRIQQAIQSATDTVQGVIGQARSEDIEGLRTTRDDMRRQGSEHYEAAKKQAADTRANLNKQAQEFQGKAKERAIQLQSDAKAYASEKMPPERRRDLIERLKVIIGQIQADPQYQEAIESVMNLLGVWRQRTNKPTERISTEATKVTEDPNVNAAVLEFKVLMQRWAQGYPLDPMIQIIQKMWKLTLTDPELRKYMDNVSHFMSKVVREPNYVTSQNVNADGELLIDQGQALMNVKYKSDTDALMHEIRTFVDKLNTDPRSREVSDRFQSFAKHLLYDKKGHLKFKPHLFEDFRYVWLPAMMESFHFIPIPRIEYADLKIDLMLDNMVLTSTDLLPRLCEMSMHHTMRLVPRGQDRHPQDAYKNEFKMLIEGVEANLHNIEYYINTKSGFKFTDRGRADILVGKKGVDIKIHGSKTPAGEDDEDGLDRTSFITFKDVKVKINNLKVKVHTSDHKILFAFAQPFIKTAIKNAIAKSIETQVREALVKGDKVLARSIRDQRIKTGKNTVGALIDTATSFVTTKVHPDKKTKASQERKSQRGHYDRTSHVIFDKEGLQVLDPVKHMELKVGTPLVEDPNEMATMSVSAPWVSTAFNMHDRVMPEREGLPGVRRPRQGLAM